MAKVRPGELAIIVRQVVSLAVGEFADDYVRRLAAMLDRYAQEPYRLTILTDRPRSVPDSIAQFSVADWPVVRPDLRATQHRIRCLKPGVLPFDEYLSLDLTLMIRSSMEPLWQAADTSRAPMTFVKDWHHEGLNGSVAHIRPGPESGAIAEEYLAGHRYEQKVLGDQEFIWQAITNQGLQHALEFFPEGLVASYRKLRKVHRYDPATAARLLDEAVILKFHGHPRPHELFDLRRRLLEAIRSPGHLVKDWGYLAAEVRQGWLEL